MKTFYLMTVVLLLASVSQTYAQQEPLFAQYNNNQYLINPAVAGSRGDHQFLLFHRWQWVSFPGAPQTYGLTYQGNIKDMHGVGALIFGDITGPMVRWGGKLSYAFHIPLADRKMRLSIGISGRLVHNRIRANAIQFIDPNDQAVTKIMDDRGVLGGDAELGVFFYGENFYVGAAAPNLMQTRFDFGSNPTARDPLGHGYRHYFVTGGYKFKFDNEENPNKNWAIEPSIMFKYVQGGGAQIDGGVMFHFLDEQLAFGAFYRSPAFLSFQCKFTFDRQVPVLLAFDIAVSKFQQYSVGATELLVGYNVPGGRNLFGEPAGADPASDPSGDKGEL